MKEIPKVFCIIILSSALFSAQGQVSMDSSISASDTVFTPNKELELRIRKCVSNSVIIDGSVNEPAWSNAVKIGNFVEITPGDNTRPGVNTEVLMTYDDDNIYFAFINYEPDISRIRVSLTERDKIFSDDYAGVIIDTYNDQKQSYELFINPYGIQGDLLGTFGNEDITMDIIWESEAKIYKDMWVGEIAVPFKSLRFPEREEMTWGIHFIRTLYRGSRIQLSWAPISRDNPSLLNQTGKLTGIKNIKGGKNLEILPYVLGSVSGYLKDPSDPGSDFVADSSVKGEVGVNLKYGFSSNMTGELTFNPDFSQVEADASRVDVNTSSALFYPEKRPFFLEGSNMFTTLAEVVYTRMINDPLFAAKLTGKIGKFDVGYISAYDEKTPFIIPYSYGSSSFTGDSLSSFSNILRLRRNLKGDSYIGMIATDREISKGFNRVLGFDGSLNFWNNYYLNWQLLYSSTKEVNDTVLFQDNTTFANGDHTLSFDGETFNGFGGVIDFQRQARYWSFGTTINSVPPETRMDLGYITSNDFNEFSMWHNYTFYPQNSFFLRISPAINASLRYTYHGKLKERVLLPNFYILCGNQIELNAAFLAVNDELYLDVFLKDVRRGWLNASYNGSQLISGGIYFEAGKFIVRFEDPPFVGFGFNSELWLTLKPVDRLIMENSYVYSELSESYRGSKLYSGYIFRNKTGFQFTKNFLLRLIVQYDSFDKQLDIDPLLMYRWNPFTIFYIGSTHTIYDYGEGGVNGNSKFVEKNRQFFAKFQYLFRI